MTHSALTNRRSLRGAATPFSFYFKAAGLALALATTVAQAQTAGEPKPASPSTLEFTDVKSGKVKIYAPEGFLENFIAENVFAGTAMGRRAAYMYGNLLAPGPQGTVTAGLGVTTSDGTVTLIPPTDLITKTGEKRVIDGIEYEFLVAPGSEAPSEMMWYKTIIAQRNRATCSYSTVLQASFREGRVSELTLAGLDARIGQELGVSEWVAIDQARIDTFASCTGDRQWIHVDVERAKRESPFRGPIAHGYLTLAMVAPLAMQIGVIPKDAAAGLNYGIDKVRFLAPVPAGARVRLRVVLAGVEPRDGGQAMMKTQNTLEVEGSEKPALIAETLALLIPATGEKA